MIAQLSSSIKGFSLNNSSYSEMVDDQCSFCKGHHAVSNSPSPTTNQLRSLPCGHILCCNCLNDSLAELGIQSNEIEDILPIDSAVNNYNGSQIIIYQCPLCQTSLTILPKRYENELSREIIQSEINNSSSSSDDEEKEDFDDENRKLIQQITSLFDSGPPEIESTNSLNLLNTSCSFHNEPMKWFCFTCNQVACDECISQATHRMHEFSLCRNAAPTLRVTLQDTCNEIHQKSEKINQKLIEIQSRNENVMYINLQNSIQEHCDNLRAAVDVLQQKLIENVEFLKNNPKEVNRLKHELSILQEVESTIGDTSNPESLGDINVCVLVSKLHESHLLLNQNHDINQLNSCDDDVPIPSLKKNKKSTTKLYEMIRDSASVYSPRQSSPYEVSDLVINY